MEKLTAWKHYLLGSILAFAAGAVFSGGFIEAGALLAGWVLLVYSMILLAKDNKPTKKWSGRIMLILIVLFLCLGVFLNIADTQSHNQTVDRPEDEVQEYKPATRDELFALVNAEREKAGVAPLQMDERLNQSAQWMADDMAARNYYAHEDPETGEQKIGTKKAFELTGVSCAATSENQNKGGGQYSTSEELLLGWLGSDPHKNALLDPEYTLAGMGVATAQDGDTMVVQHFCDTTWDRKCQDVTSHDYNWQNDMICTNTDGSRFYTSYEGANAFLAQ